MAQLDSRCTAQPTEAMLVAFIQFNRGEYFEQHETLELIWRAERDDTVRNFYKGILQIGVGCYHLTRRNPTGAIKVMTRGIAYLRPYAPRCMGVEVQRLIDDASRVLAIVQAEGEINLARLPRVHYEVK